MDLTAWLLRHTPPRPLVVTLPGGTESRLAVERETRERGWLPATSPAEANMLAVAGPSNTSVDPYVERVWEQLPAPRTLANVHSPAMAKATLEAAEAELRDVAHQRHQTTRANQPSQAHAEHTSHHMSGHSGHDMAMPGDIPMADRAEDRDGLMLDQLHLPLGPLLPDWPAGLIVHTTLQGDVIQHATIETLPGHPHPFWHDNPAAALDSCARLLSVAGWTDAAATARRLRDAALLGNTEHIATWVKRVRRSRTLRWLLADIGTTPNNPTTPPELRGDALARLHHWLELPPRTISTQWTLGNLPALLEGTELATARLIVASLDPDLDHA